LPPAYVWRPGRTYLAPPSAAFFTVIAADCGGAGLESFRLDKSHSDASVFSDARPAIMPKILPKTVDSQSLKFNVFCGFRAV
jgi:hypothetical protein